MTPPYPFLLPPRLQVDSWFLVCGHSDSFACPIFLIESVQPKSPPVGFAVTSGWHYTQLGENHTTAHCSRQLQGQQPRSDFQGLWSSSISLGQFFPCSKTWWLSTAIFMTLINIRHSNFIKTLEPLYIFFSFLPLPQASHTTFTLNSSPSVQVHHLSGLYLLRPQIQPNPF